ncbi:hypothetical protein AWB67_02471 [Caballeronia terrestris]|uniref:Uncharacterized protein n=1 Tax=Caballeronia terrestris TaxID=1226301 RepID=A0A158IGJ3_9BURK|nr:hypothetical protein [Caballeronia terrestris]SAL55221.1 hypothetical protein AWB67_02471 [Caballeronia terrestris]
MRIKARGSISPTLPIRSFVVSYDEEEEKLVVCAVNRADIDPFIAGALKAEWPLSSMENQIDDKIARRLGITAFEVLALYNPSLKQHLRITPLEPLDQPPPPESK